MSYRVHYSGLVIAGIGFFLTRFTVTLALYEDPVRFYLAGVVPLGLGLGLAAFGIALTVADVDSSIVRTTALWCVLGAGMMFVLVLLTLLASSTDQMSELATIRSRAYLSNFLIGGAIGGTLTGLYASRNQRSQRELRHQANRLEVLNRLLRHEILNALTAIKGYAGIDGDPTAKAVIEDKVDAIERTIEEVKYLTQSASPEDRYIASIDLLSHLRESIETIRDRYPDANISLSVETDTPAVHANDRLQHVFDHLLENAILYASDDDSPVTVLVDETDTSVQVSVSDTGPGLPLSQQNLLETGEIERFDNPDMGYGLNVVRLLVENYQGSIDTSVDEGGTTITVSLPRSNKSGTSIRSTPTSLITLRPDVPQLFVTLVAALVAGVFYGIASESLGGSIAGIGVFYGTPDPVVGWITHEFHSVVFGFVFLSLLSLAPRGRRNSYRTQIGIATGWGVVLWFVAAGVIAPIWLQLLGIPAPIPNLSAPLLVNHVVWGIFLGAGNTVGYRYIVPRLSRLHAGLRRSLNT